MTALTLATALACALASGALFAFSNRGCGAARRCGLAREVGLVGARELGAALGLLPVLLAAEGGEVEEGSRSRRSTRRRGRKSEYVWKTRSPSRRKQLVPGMSNGGSDSSHAPGAVAVVVLDRLHSGVERDVEVVVEVAAVRRVPGERPALLGLVALDLLERGARDVGERVSRTSRCSRRPSATSSAPAVQLGQPSSQSGWNMKWPTISWWRPSNRSSRPTSPSGH